MCGIVTVFGSDMGPVHGQVMKDLLILDQVRGMHATGVLKVDSQGNVLVKKEPVNGATFVSDTDNKAFVTTLSSSRGIIGHNRWATMGTLVAENAHPFQHDHITMVHNGTLDSQDTLATDEANKSFEVDSNQLAFTLSQWGVQRTVRQTDGAFVLAWHDQTENSFNFVRNSKRPFWLAKVTGKDVYIGASEKWMIEVACARQKTAVTVDEPQELPIGQHVKYVLGKGAYANKTSRPVVTPVTFMPYNETFYGSWGAGVGGNYNYNSRPARTTQVYTAPKTAGARNNTVKTELAALGLTVQQEVSAYLTYFRPYPGSSDAMEGRRIGVAYGCLDNLQGPNIPCAVHAVNEKDFIMGEYEAVVSSIQHNLRDYDGALLKDCVLLQGLLLTKSWETEQDKLVDDPDQPCDDEVDASTMYVYGPSRALITTQKFEQLTVHGCGLCTTDIFEEEDEDISWENDTPICQDCTERRELDIYTPEESKKDMDELDNLPRQEEHPERRKLTLVH